MFVCEPPGRRRMGNKRETSERRGQIMNQGGRVCFDVRNKWDEQKSQLKK